MSGLPICPITDPSSNSTAECRMLCGWMRTCICSKGTSKSHLASMISSPLFIMVAESTVILSPMDQFGCLRACASVTFSSFDLEYPLKGPPEAVSRMRRIVFPALP